MFYAGWMVMEEEVEADLSTEPGAPSLSLCLVQAKVGQDAIACLFLSVLHVIGPQACVQCSGRMLAEGASSRIQMPRQAARPRRTSCQCPTS